MQSPFINFRLPGPFARRRGRGAAPAFDPDAATYIAAVEAADEQELEPGLKQAIDGFVTGCKADGVWDAIKASCILAGARTLNGALVPLAGDAPTNFNFVSDDYDRVTGLKGDGSTKYLDSNRATNADPQNNNHAVSFLSSAGVSSSTETYLHSSNRRSDGATGFGRSSTATQVFIRSVNSGADSVPEGATVGFMGLARNNASNFTFRASETNTVISRNSQTPASEPFFLFAHNEAFTNARLSFYSIGESIDLAALDTRVSALMADLAFTLNTGLSPYEYDRDTINYVNAGYAAGGSLA